MRQKTGGAAVVSSDQFVNAKMWYDACEASTDRDYSHHFDRVSQLKKILWDTNATAELPDGTPGVGMEAFVEMLRVPAAREKSAKKFADFLFAEVKPVKH